MQQLEAMTGELGDFAKGVRGKVRVLSNTAATLEFLPPLLGPFLAAHPQLDFVGLPTGSALQEHLDGHATRAGTALRLRVRLPGFEALCRVVENGIGIAVVSHTAAARWRKSMAIKVVPLTDPWSRRRLRLCVRAERALPAPARTLLDHLRRASA
jgi:DNA-binding transcriptional LysR family regulator